MIPFVIRVKASPSSSINVAKQNPPQIAQYGIKYFIRKSMYWGLYSGFSGGQTLVFTFSCDSCDSLRMSAKYWVKGDSAFNDLVFFSGIIGFKNLLVSHVHTMGIMWQIVFVFEFTHNFSQNFFTRRFNRTFFSHLRLVICLRRATIIRDYIQCKIVSIFASNYFSLDVIIGLMFARFLNCKNYRFTKIWLFRLF